MTATPLQPETILDVVSALEQDLTQLEILVQQYRSSVARRRAFILTIPPEAPQPTSTSNADDTADVEDTAEIAKHLADDIVDSLSNLLALRDNLEYQLDVTSRRQSTDDTEARDRADHDARKRSESTQLLARIARIDERLRRTGRQATRIISLPALHINLQATSGQRVQWWQTHTYFAKWRDSHPTPDSLGWWWHLDEPNLLGDFARLSWVAFTILLILASLWIAGATASQVSLVFIDVLRSANLSEQGLDLIALGAALAQVIFGGRVSLEFSQRAINRLNLWLERLFPGTVRAPNYFGAALTFFTLVLLLRGGLFVAQQTLRTDTDRALEQGDVAGARTNLQYLAVLDTSQSTRSATLTQLGALSEEYGDIDRARSSYTSALENDPNNIIARYRLAEIAIDSGDLDLAIQLLDEGLLIIRQSSNPEVNLPVTETVIPQLEVLLLTSRGRAFLELGEPRAARIDLENAEEIINHEDNRDLFALSVNSPVTAVPVAETYYHLARTHEALARREDRGDGEAARSARAAWIMVSRLANTDIGEQRLWQLEATEALSRRPSSNDNPPGDNDDSPGGPPSGNGGGPNNDG